MTIKTIMLTQSNADIIEKNCSQYGCEFVNKKPAGRNPNTLKDYITVTVSGSDEDVNALFDLIGE